MMKKIGKILLIIIGILTIILITNTIIGGSSWQKMKYSMYKEGKDYYLDKFECEQENQEILKSQPSEIEGMTRYDKLQAGLSPYLEDTDSDGISDADELAIGSDPTKVSTSGDMYPDGYKLLHDMDIDAYYDFEQNEDMLKKIIMLKR